MQCRHCGTTKTKTGNEFKTQGQLNLHEYHCWVKQQRTGARSSPAQKEEICSHNWRLLNPHKPEEAAAMQSNYGEVCTKCQDLR